MSDQNNGDAILILEDDEKVITSLNQLFEDVEFPMELIFCRTYSEYEAVTSNQDTKHRIKCFIMDLSNDKSEDDSNTFKSVQYILEEYENNRVPIFIHSAYLSKFEELGDKGTVFKILKTTRSPNEIVGLIQKMSVCGFLNIFSRGGTLENKIMKEIHNSFVCQFKPKEVHEIINSIEKANPNNIIERTTEVFERIGIRSVYQNTIGIRENNESVKVNAIEHYYRRSEGYKFWTGDIFKNKENNSLVFIATPRCNIANKNFNNILICSIIDVNQEDVSAFLKPKDGSKKISNKITDNLVGERLRFLPRTPQFKGGFVDFVEVHTISAAILLEEFEYVISLVDDLTNDIIRKLASYLLRGGISDTHYDEAIYYFQENSDDKP
ncbi:hypothetical protein [Rufibacter sp. XAAS-G3-1]|uniref:hypothetical protein n=1 Tax=Rufibacter sp. XAAS-G3-1 TaxID=2729134 RepID=UPI0015E67643|nr:hypothetical protein [Rufibacter sp. XAAS-G3-1]